jgi:hypothetical protein
MLAALLDEEQAVTTVDRMAGTMAEMSVGSTAVTSAD